MDTLTIRDILGEPLKSNGPNVAVLERAACQPPCARRNPDGAWPQAAPTPSCPISRGA
jgi:hypothetical protein